MIDDLIKFNEDSFDSEKRGEGVIGPRLQSRVS